MLELNKSQPIYAYESYTYVKKSVICFQNIENLNA